MQLLFPELGKRPRGTVLFVLACSLFFLWKNVHYIVNLVVIVFFQGLDTCSHTMFHAVLEHTTLSWGAPNSKQSFYHSLLNIDITITGIPHHDCLNSHSLKKECSEVLSTIICSPCGVQLHKMIHSYEAV